MIVLFSAWIKRKIYFPFLPSIHFPKSCSVTILITDYEEQWAPEINGSTKGHVFLKNKRWAIAVAALLTLFKTAHSEQSLLSSLLSVSKVFTSVVFTPHVFLTC